MFKIFLVFIFMFVLSLKKKNLWCRWRNQCF